MRELLNLIDVSERDAQWMASALCAQVDPELFHPDKGGTPAAAKATCAKCPVTKACLEYALEYEDRPNVYAAWGVFGGLSAYERNEIRRAPRRAEREDAA